MASTSDEFRSLALVEANKWAATRGAAGAHPGSKDISEVADVFYKFLTGKSDSATTSPAS